jgi:hypothetical protein
MPRLALQIRAQLENVTDVRPSDDNYTVMAKLKCTSCQEEHPKLVGFSRADDRDLSKGRSTANLVMNCHFCKRELTAKFEEPTAKAPLWRPYAPSAGATFETIAVVEARGLDFLSIDFQVSYLSMRDRQRAATDARYALRHRERGNVGRLSLLPRSMRSSSRTGNGQIMTKR